MSGNTRERGAALLMAMLTVALVATFAAAATWQQWRSIEVESAERQRGQAEWILNGALDWARLVLREDARTGSIDYLGEPWAVPLQEARLSSFLAAEQGGGMEDTGSGGDILDAFLSGQITDLQSLMNITNLVDGGKVSQTDYAAFVRLFQLLNIPEGQLQTMADNLRLALDTSTDNASAPNSPLAPQNVQQLVWLGLSPEAVTALAPYVTVLPMRTTINVNTASAEVISSTMGISVGDARELVAARARSPFKTAAEATALVPNASTLAPANVGVATQYFEVDARLRLDKLVVEERSVVQRIAPLQVTVLSRERGVADAATRARAAAAAAAAETEQR